MPTLSNRDGRSGEHRAGCRRARVGSIRVPQLRVRDERARAAEGGALVRRVQCHWDTGGPVIVGAMRAFHRFHGRNLTVAAGTRQNLTVDQ